MTARLLSIGIATPPAKLDFRRYVTLANRLTDPLSRTAALDELTRKTEISERGCCILDESGELSLYLSARGELGPGTRERLDQYIHWATRLGLDACAQAIDRAAIEPGAVTHLVTASCTGFDAPGFDQGLINRLSLRPTVRRTHIGFMGCHAAVNALAVAAAFAVGDPKAVVLVCCAEVCSLHYHFGDRVDQIISNALFADGAAAAIVSRHGPASSLEIVDCASAIFPNTADLMSWRIGNNGFEMSLGASVPEALTQYVPEWIRSTLDRHELSVGAIGGWAIHPGGPRIVRAIADALGLPPEASAPSLDVLRACGNMSSPTILFILRRLWDRAVPRPWVTLAFGPGLAGEMALIK